MEKCDTQRLPLGLIAVLMLTACAGTACSQQNDRQVTAAGSTPQLEQLKAAGKGASLTVLPAGLGGSQVPLFL